MTTDYMINRIARSGYKVTRLGKKIEAERQFEKYRGSISFVYSNIFKKNAHKVIKRLEHELELKNEYIKGLEELLYKKTFTDNKQ